MSPVFGLSFGTPLEDWVVYSSDGNYMIQVTPVRLTEKRDYRHLSVGNYIALNEGANPPTPEQLVPWLALWSLREADHKCIWRRPLDVMVAPRTASVSNEGNVILLGEWFEVLGKRALAFMTFNNHGGLIGRYRLDDLFNAVQIEALAERDSPLPAMWWDEVESRSIRIAGAQDPFSENVELHINTFYIELSDDLRGSRGFPAGFTVILNGPQEGEVIPEQKPSKRARVTKRKK
ncbi:MAG: hypothetical protein K0R17_2356 [Rariglobus sp.]|nr:hypothetical protein [Rariglobus sp.]